MDDKIESIKKELELREVKEEESPREKELENEWVKKRFTDALRPAKWRIHPFEIIGILALIPLLLWWLPCLVQSMSGTG